MTIWYINGMMSNEQLRRFREMTPEERYRIFDELMSVAEETLLRLPPEEREKRFEILRKQNEAESRRLSECFRRLP